eukprot:TRINITY_DN22955_c0_g1_i1.p1 TRINITY_DN22955_c0_g1~~TRINITY_DN22955_c0_g1_i1.p1  ORF type:complete len:445 (-),score=21.63 TRINITY_DN22955_c0_g1_i1:1090-2424(-)
MVGGTGSWLTLMAFCYTAASNAFLFMNFCTVTDLSQEIFHISTAQVTMTFSVALFATLPCTFIAAYYLQRKSWGCFCAAAILNAIAAWLRWWSVKQRSFAICMASTACVGFSFAVCCMAYAVVGERWFEGTQRLLATSIGVQSNYGGWCISAWLIPTVVKTMQDQEVFLFRQALAVSFGLILFAAFHSERAAKPLEEPAPVGSSVATMMKSPDYLIQLACYSTLGAISYAIPGVQDGLLGDTLGLGSDQTKWTNVVFIASGVAAGLLAGYYTPPHPHNLIKLCFVIAACAMLVISFMIGGGHVLEIGPPSLRVVFDVLLAAMGLAGAASLGFLGLGLAVITEAVPGVNEAYSAGAVEWFVQLGGAVLTQLASSPAGFHICTSLAVLVAILLVACGPVPNRDIAAPIPCVHSRSASHSRASTSDVEMTASFQSNRSDPSAAVTES